MAMLRPSESLIKNIVYGPYDIGQKFNRHSVIRIYKIPDMEIFHNIWTIDIPFHFEMFPLIKKTDMAIFI